MAHETDKYRSGNVDKREASFVVSLDKIKAKPLENDGYVVLQDGEMIPIVNTTVSRQFATGTVGKMPVATGFLDEYPVTVL